MVAFWTERSSRHIVSSFHERRTITGDRDEVYDLIMFLGPCIACNWACVKLCDASHEQVCFVIGS